MDDKKYASFTDDFRARIERERAQGGSGDARDRGAHFKGKDENQRIFTRGLSFSF